jgi:hypothetical protein
LQHFPQIGKAFGNAKPLSQLFGHQQFPIAKSHNLAIGDPIDGLYVLVSNLSAANYSDSQHG